MREFKVQIAPYATDYWFMVYRHGDPILEGQYKLLPGLDEVKQAILKCLEEEPLRETQ